MATTLNILTEEIIRIYRRGLDKENTSPLDPREVKIKIPKVVNTLIKAEHIQRGDVSGTVVATYDFPRQGEGPYFIELTVNPVSLPKEQGVHRVFPKNCPWDAYIPMINGDMELIRGTFAEFIEGRTGYFLEGRKLIFTRKPTENITVKLVVYDPNSLSDNDVIPIPPEMEFQVIQAVLQMYGMGQISQYELNSKNE
jgi:hypothetical protein